MVLLLGAGASFKESPDAAISKSLKLQIQNSVGLIARNDHYANQRRWYLKVVQLLNSQNANIAPDADKFAALKQMVDPFELSDLKYPTTIDYAGESFTFERAETSHLEAITLIYQPAAQEKGSATRSIEITVAPGDICAATEAAAKALEFRVAHKSDLPHSMSELEIDLDGNGFLLQHARKKEFFEMTIERFADLPGTKGYLRTALIHRIPLSQENLESEIKKLAEAGPALAEPWRKFSPEIEIRQPAADQ
jgi:hypothetical protein